VYASLFERELFRFSIKRTLIIFQSFTLLYTFVQPFFLLYFNLSKEKTRDKYNRKSLHEMENKSSLIENLNKVTLALMSYSQVHFPSNGTFCFSVKNLQENMIP
jgi:hypothetical protein